MIEKWQSHKSQICLLIIEILRDHNGKKIYHFLTQKFPKKSHSRGMKCKPKGNNMRKAVVVWARDVVKE